MGAICIYIYLDLETWVETIDVVRLWRGGMFHAVDDDQEVGRGLCY